MSIAPSPPLSTQTDQRLLAAIVFTDVAGFSRRMQVAEEATLKLLERDFFSMREFVPEHGGRVIKSTGDGLLIFFNSAVQAVQWALKAQRHLAEQAESLDSEEILKHRVGVHIGDVVIQGNDVMGDGVNIAARLQAHAPPGGICISHDVYALVKNKLKLDVIHLEPRQLKNIHEPVQMYHVLLQPLAATPQHEFRPAATRVEDTPTSGWKKWAAGLALLAVIGVGAALLLQAHRRHQEELAGSQGLREALGAITRQDTATQPPANLEAAAPAEANPRPTVAAAPVNPKAPPAPAALDFALLASGRSGVTRDAAQTARALQAAREYLPALELWTQSALARRTRESPLEVTPLGNRGFSTTTLFTENGQLYFAVGGATSRASWNALTTDRRGAIIMSLLKSLPPQPPEVVRGAEAFALVHRLPEMAEMLLRERGK